MPRADGALAPMHPEGARLASRRGVLPYSTPLWLAPAWLLEPGQTSVEGTVTSLAQWLRLGVELIGAIVIGIGIVVAAVTFARDLFLRRSGSFTAIRLTLGRYLVLALEFQLGADLLSTAINPTWDQLGRLASIAVIRTALNFFLTRELREAGAIMSGEAKVDDRAKPVAG